MYQLWLLEEGSWIEKEIVESGKGYSRRTICKELKEKYRCGTWKLRVIA